MDIALQLAEIYGGGLNPQAQAMQPAAANDVQKFQQFMSTPASQDYSIENPFVKLHLTLLIKYRLIDVKS
jgi:hypothetical protein